MRSDVEVSPPISSISSNHRHSSNRHRPKLTFRATTRSYKKWITSRYRGRSELYPYQISITWEIKTHQPRTTPEDKLFNHRTTSLLNLIRVVAFSTKPLCQPVLPTKYSSTMKVYKVERLGFSRTVSFVRMKQIWIMLATILDRLRKATY